MKMNNENSENAPSQPMKPLIQAYKLDYAGAQKVITTGRVIKGLGIAAGMIDAAIGVYLSIQSFSGISRTDLDSNAFMAKLIGPMAIRGFLSAFFAGILIYALGVVICVLGEMLKVSLDG